MVVISGVLTTQTGQQIPLYDSGAANGTEADLDTDPALTVSAMGVGDYMPGAVVTGGYITSLTNSISLAYILRQGQILVTIPVQTSGNCNQALLLPKTIRLQPGDVVRCRPASATDRYSVLTTYTAGGNCRMFVGTSSGAATNNLLDLQTGNNIGATLNGDVIISASFNTVDGSTAGRVISAGGAQILDSAGRLIGTTPVTAVQNVQMNSTSVRVPIALNYVAQWVTAS
jgi:hypothetical protein